MRLLLAVDANEKLTATDYVEIVLTADHFADKATDRGSSETAYLALADGFKGFL